MISFIIPFYNEEESLRLLYDKIINVVNKVMITDEVFSYEFWFVDDGSNDKSTNIIKDIIRMDDNVHLIVFRKNFGKAAALQAAFKKCNGDIVITMDADLQDEPEEIPNFIEKINEGYDLVSGWKFDRHDPIEKRLPSKLFNRVTALLSGVKLHDFNCGFKAYTRDVVKNIDVYGELHRYIPVIAHRKGFKITEIKVRHNKREFGKSKYGFERYLRGLFDSLTVSFLNKYYDKPMHFFGRFGMAFSLIGLAIGVYLTVIWFSGQSIGNRPLLTLSVLLIILGVQFFSIGLIGDMLLDASHRLRYNDAHIKEII